MKIYVAFTQDVGIDGGWHDEGGVLFPQGDFSENAVVAASNAKTLTYAQIYDMEERRLLWASPMILRSGCSYPYVSTAYALSAIIDHPSREFQDLPLHDWLLHLGHRWSGLGGSSLPTHVHHTLRELLQTFKRLEPNSSAEQITERHQFQSPSPEQSHPSLAPSRSAPRLQLPLTSILVVAQMYRTSI